MDDAGPMGGGEPGGGLQPDGDDLGGRERPCPQARVQVLALEELHREVLLPAAVLAEVEDPDHVRVLERHRRDRLAFEATASALRTVAAEPLEGDGRTSGERDGAIDDPHSPAGEAVEDPV